MPGFEVSTDNWEVETIAPAKAEHDKLDPEIKKSLPSDLDLSGRSLSLRWSDFVVRVAGGGPSGRPIFAMNNATVVYLEAMTTRGPIVQIVFSGVPQGEFIPQPALSVQIYTEDVLKGVLDEWNLRSWSDGQFCNPPKPYTEQRRLGPLGDLNYFDKISLTRMFVPSSRWRSCPNVPPR